MIPYGVNGIVNFPNVKDEDLKGVLTISITAVNGVKAQNLNASGYMKVETGDVETNLGTSAYGFNSVMPVAFSPDGRQIISGSFGESIKLWETTTGRLLKTLGIGRLMPKGF